MAQGNGKARDERPFIISGGGIGGLATAYALAHKGFPVRVIEQAAEFREVGAGIQLGPNIFRALARIGLKDAVLADAHVPTGMEMRDAITGKVITQIPLGTQCQGRFRGALRRHPPSRHSRGFPQRLPRQQSGHAGKQPTGRCL